MVFMRLSPDTEERQLLKINAINSDEQMIQKINEILYNKREAVVNIVKEFLTENYQKSNLKKIRIFYPILLT